MAFGSRDGRVYIHGAKSFKMGKTADLPSKGSHVHRFDFSVDSNAIRVATDQEELDVFNAATGIAISDVVSLKQHVWYSHDCPYAYQTKGVWKQSKQSDSGGTKKVTSIGVSDYHALAVACYDDGTVALSRYPCINEKAKSLMLNRCSYGATRAEFTADGKYLLILEPKLRNIFIYTIST
jgi:hypothetical protein